MQYKRAPKEVLARLTYDDTAPGCVVGGDSMHRQEVESWLTSKRAELHKEFAHG